MVRLEIGHLLLLVTLELEVEMIEEELRWRKAAVVTFRENVGRKWITSFEMLVLLDWMSLRFHPYWTQHVTSQVSLDQLRESFFAISLASLTLFLLDDDAVAPIDCYHLCWLLDYRSTDVECLPHRSLGFENR